MDDAAAALCVSHERPVACVSTHCDVFLSSAGGSDAARESFPGRLHASLAAAGVIGYGPDESQPSLLPDEAFRWFKICIPILSKDYPSSEKCLHELVQMIEGKRSARQKVLPIFDRVEPSHVRYLIGSFEKARCSDVVGAQRALIEVSMLQGWKVTDGREEELVKIVVQTVRRYLQPDLQKGPHMAQYNVFLNFRGADTRHSFTYGLYTNLRRAGVSVFKDDTDLPIGEDFGSQLLSTISRSTIYITILSPNYASSMWCVHELKKMLECKEKMGHLVFPVFYKVGRPREKFLDALRKHELRPGGMDATRVARKALQDVCNLGGLHSSDSGLDEQMRDWSDGDLIHGIVHLTLRHLRYHFKLDVPEHLLRLWDVEERERLSRLQLAGQRMVPKKLFLS